MLKRAVIFFLTVFLLALAPAIVFAGNNVPPYPSAPSALSDVEEERGPAPFMFITGETDDFQPENEYSITFSNKITIIAESAIGARIRLSVTSGEEPWLVAEEYEEVVIGPSLKYIQPVLLELGDNIVKISVEKDGYEYTEKEYLIKRKDGFILESLQKLIVIPGKLR